MNPDVQAQLDLLALNCEHEILCGGDPIEAAKRFGDKTYALLVEAQMKGLDISVAS